jgi:transcriptional regulator with XRE-family HTH domain
MSLDAQVRKQDTTMGRRLAALRVLKGMTQQEASRLLEVDQSHLSRIEGDLVSPSMSVLSRLADVYGASLDFIVNGEVAA